MNLRKLAAPIATAIALTLSGATLSATADGTPTPFVPSLSSYANAPDQMKYVKPGRSIDASVRVCDGPAEVRPFAWDGGALSPSEPRPDGRPGIVWPHPDGGWIVLEDGRDNVVKNDSNSPVLVAFWCGKR